MENMWKPLGCFGGIPNVEAPMAAYFAAQNRNKSSVTLNYTKPEGQERCWAMKAMDLKDLEYHF